MQSVGIHETKQVLNTLSSEQSDDPSQICSVTAKKNMPLGLQLSGLPKNSERGSSSGRSSESNVMANTVDMNIDVQVKFRMFRIPIVHLSFKFWKKIYSRSIIVFLSMLISKFTIHHLSERFLREKRFF